MKKKNQIKEWIVGITGILLLVLFDQWTKALAVLHLKGQQALSLWEGIFELSYVENRGAAFGVMQDQQTIFLVLTIAVIILMIGIVLRMPTGRRYLPGKVTILFLGAGAIGNFIDRVSQGYVVDFFYFKLIDFPVFNVADIYVTVAVAVMAYLLLFYYTEEELDGMLRFRR